MSRAVASALALGLGLAASATDDAGDPLYQWTDRRGVVRYTPDPDRIPRNLRDSAVLVEPGRITPPPGPTPGLPASSPETAASRGSDGEAAEALLEPDPFNAPGRAPRVEEEHIERPRPASSDRAAEPDPRIRELEEAIARDEEKLKELISQASGDGPDPLLDSPELREIARRLPALQADLRALRERRDHR